MRIFGYNNPRQLLCLHYCDTYKGGKNKGWEFYMEENTRTTWRCRECGKERYGVNMATYLRKMPKDEKRLEYMKNAHKGLMVLEVGIDD